MPADPVKAVFWFMHWLLRVLVRFFYILILAAVIYESIINGVVGFFGTLLVGLGVWAGLALLLFVFNLSTGVKKSFQKYIGCSKTILRVIHSIVLKSRM